MTELADEAQHRGTGRTTRALEEVRKLAEAGHSVVFVSHSVHFADSACGIMAERWNWHSHARRELHLGTARVRFISATTFTRIADTLRGTRDRFRMDHAFWDNIETGSQCGDIDMLGGQSDAVLDAAEVETAPPEAKGHHERLTYLANAAQMLRTRLNELTEEERDMVDDWIEDLRIGQTVEGADALDAILVALGAGD